MARNPAAPSTAQVVRDYIDLHPSVRDCLRMGILNLSALARKIKAEREAVTSEEAALIACRRYAADAARPTSEEAILRVLRRSKLEIRTKVSILTARPSWHIFQKLEKAMRALQGRNHPLHVIQGSASVTVITDGSVAGEMADILGADAVMKRQDGLVELAVTSPEVIEDVPGILAHLASSLSGKGVNFVEAISCYKDTYFVIEEADMVQAIDTLNRVLNA